MKPAAERLLDLLPEVFRTRDAAAATEIAARLGLPAPSLDGTPEGPLTSLLEVLGHVFDMLEAEVDNLYDDLFIETCDPSLVPYIGALVGARIVETGDMESARRQVATTIAARRAKGTARALALRAGAVMDSPTEAIEYFRHIVTALHLDYPEDNRAMSAAINGRAGRRATLPDHIGQYTPELRSPLEGGRYAVPNIGVRSWTTRALRHAETTPRPGSRMGQFRFAPTGADVPLWRKRTEDRPEVTRLSLAEMPGPIPLVDAVDNPGDYYGPDKSVAVTIDGVLQPLDEICFCDLSDRPAGGWNRHGSNADRKRIRIDPARGRMRLPSAIKHTPADAIRVMYHYGAAIAAGGGGYAVPAPFEADIPTSPGDDPVPVLVPFADTRDAVATALADALTSATGRTEVRIEDGGITRPPDETVLAEDMQLRLCADDGTWPTLEAHHTGWKLTGGQGSTLVIRGLRKIGGPLIVETEGLAKLRLVDCTLLPGHWHEPDGEATHPGSIALKLHQEGLEVELERCVVGRVEMKDKVQLSLVDCVVDGAGVDARALGGFGDFHRGILSAERTTVIGDVNLRGIGEVSNCLFARRPADDPAAVNVSVTHVQQGCARYSAFPPGAVVPGRYRCYPDHATDEARSPDFAALSAADPSYAVPLPSSPAEILSGAEGGMEMGATFTTSWSRRVMLLARDLPDWTPFAMQAGVELMN